MRCINCWKLHSQDVDNTYKAQNYIFLEERIVGKNAFFFSLIPGGKISAEKQCLASEAHRTSCVF